MQIVVDSLLTEYARVGKGKPVVVLHGWADSSKGWQAFCDALSDQFELVVPDLPGFGGSEMPPETWGLDDYATFMAAFLKKIQMKPYAIIAHSNGGAIAVRGLAKGWLKTERLVLFDSAGIRNQYKGRTKTIRMITKAGKALTMPLPANLKKRLQRKVYQTVGSDMLVVERLQETFKRVVTDDIQTDAVRLHLPTLIVYGEDDLDTPVRYGQILHGLMSKSQLEIIPGAGHFVYTDKPEAVHKIVKDFLA